MKNPPSFQFYPKDFLTDYNVMMMTHEQVGCYWKLCCICWIEGSLPDDQESIAKLLSVPEGWFNNNWKAIERCFKKSPFEEGRLIHPRLAIERQKQIDWIKKCSSGGRNSAKSRGYKLKGCSSLVELPFNRVSSRVVQHARRRQETEDRRQETEEEKGKEKRAREEKPHHFTEQDCELVYQAYPKKVGRGAALKKIAVALQKISADHPTDCISWLLERTQQYCEIVHDKDPQFIPHPATWFNQERYSDDFDILRKEENRHGQSESKQEQIERKLRESSKRFLEATQQPDEQSGENFSARRDPGT